MLNILHQRQLWFLALFSAMLTWGAGADVPEILPESAHDRVRIALQWLPQSQFAGFYMARDRGFYEREGLDVELIHTGPGPSSFDFLKEGRADFATMFLADAIVEAGGGTPVILVAQIVHRSNLMLVCWKDRGIMQPADLDGLRVSYWPVAFSAAFTAFFRQHGIRPDVLPQHYTVNLFLNRGVAACAAMIYNEFHRIYQAGIDYDQLTVFMMRDYDLGFPEDGLYALTETAGQNPGLCRALRRATLKGWDYARRYPEQTIEAVLRESRKGRVPANRPHTRWMLDRILESIFAPGGDSASGRLDPDVYRQTVDVLKGAGLIESAPAFELFAPFEREMQ